MFTNRPVLTAEGTVPANYFDKNYWEAGAQSGKGSYNSCTYENNPNLCQYWARDTYNRWGPFKDYLELGCGRGWAIWGFLNLPELGVSPKGVDISHYAITTAVEQVKPYLIEANASRMPFFENLSFDLVFSNDFLEHLSPDQIRDTLRECSRISRHRIVHLVSIGDGKDYPIGQPPANGDQSHMTMKPTHWWVQMFSEELASGWEISTIEHGTTIEMDCRRR